MNVAVMDNAAKLRALAERVAASAPAERLALVERLRTADLSLGDLPVPRADRTRPLPASDLQRRLWILWRLDPASAAYAVGGGLRLRGRLDASALRRAFDAAATRHEILRTRFCEDAGGTLSQIVDPPGPCDFAQADLAAAADPEAALAQAARETIEAPFDLEKGPLLRLRLLRLGEDDHALVMALHHAVCDGWSLEILGREVSEAYAAFAGGHAFEAPVPSIQFADWAAWRAARLEAGEFEDAIARSVARLEGFPRAAALGGFVDENAEPDGRALRLPLAFSPEAGAGAQALARALGTTGFSVSLAIFCAFLRRIAGQSRFIVGAPAANREGAAAQDVLGAFVNTLALPIEVDAGASLRSLVTAVDAAVRTAQEGQEAPFERVVEALGGGPPFNVMFAYQRAAPPPVFAGLAATPIEALPEAAKFDLAFGVEEGEGGALAGMLVFARARFSRESAARLRGRLLRFFEEAALRPDAPLVDLDMLPPAERGLLARWGAPRRAPAFVSAAQLISALSSSAPFRPALVGSGFRLNYGELASVSNGVAVALARLGAGREARVALVFGRTPLAIVAMLGALKAGAAYVPLDPDAPAERNAAMIADAGASVLVCEDGDRRADALAPGLPRLRLDPASLPSAAEAPQVEAHPDQLAYVVFTSGSTGRPKGVGVAHGPLAMHAREVGALYGANPDDVVLHVISFSFDGATECWLAALAHGGRLVVADPKSLAPADLLALVRREGVTIVGMTPALLMSLVEAQDGEGGGPLPVRSWTAGGEAFALKDFARLRAAFPSARIINGYGPTEAVITPTLFAAAPDAPAARYASPAGEAGFVPIGTPVGARAAHVLDEDMNEVGVGVAGELHLGGYGLARGYLGRPGETALRFVPDPFGPRGARLYRTGDRVRRREDGGLDYLGRLDRQAKIRGFRIEPGEVEAQLVADPLCREAAAVVARRAGAPQLVAYVAPARTPVAQALDAATLASRLRTRLEARLPDYMRPSLIEVLPALPRLPNGKIDRLALPEPAWPHTAYEPPRTETERALAAIWESLLDARPIGRAQSFLELGGNSITAIKMTAGIRKKLGARLDLRAAFDAPTLADMARLIESAPRADGERETIMPAPDGPAPATPTQEEIHRWLRARPSSPAYNVDGAVRLSGSIDPLAFARAFDALVERHEALRTGLRFIDGELKQVALPPRAVFEHLDLGGLPDAARQAEAAARRNVLRPFDLTAGPLLRALLVSAGPTDHILTIVAHHAVVDAQAMDVLLEELSLLLERRPLVPAPRRLRDYACWRRFRDAGPEFERRLAQARERLSGAWSAWPVAPDRPAEAGFSDAGGRVRFEIAAPLVASLRAQATAARASLPILVLAALGATLCRWARVERVGLEVLMSDRRHPDAERIVGVLLDSDVAIVRAPEDAPFCETLAAVREDRLAAETAPPIPFRRLIEAIADKDEPPLEILFNYLRRAAAPARSLAGVPIEDFPMETGAETHPLEFDFIEDADGRLACSVGYLAALFDPATVEGLLAAFRAALATIAADPRTPASHLTRRDHVDH